MKLSRISLILVLGVVAPAYSQFTEWSTPRNVGAPVNSSVAELGPFLSKDGLTLYFGRGATQTAIDLWVSRRASEESPWETPENLGPNVNTAALENNAVLSPDEHRLYFTSNRPDGFGGNDLYVSRRHNKRDPLGWEPPTNLGSNVNSPANETRATFFEDETTGLITMYFDSNRPGLGGFDIYASTLLPDDTFTPAVLVPELSTPFNDQQPSVRRDGLEIYLASDRPGNVGVLNLMVSTRSSTTQPWSAPVYLPSTIHSPERDAAPTLSFDGTALFFQSTAHRPDATGPCLPAPGVCVFDLYVMTRSKGKDSDQ